MSHNEIEDGMGFSGLVPTKAERWLERELKSLRLALKTAELQRDNWERACRYILWNTTDTPKAPNQGDKRMNEEKYAKMKNAARIWEQRHDALVVTKDALRKAIKRGGFVLGNCKICGEQVVYLEDGLTPICCDCATNGLNRTKPD